MRDRAVKPLLIVAVVAVSFSAIFVRLSTAHPVVLALYRVAVSALVLAAWGGVRRTFTPGVLKGSRASLTLVAGGLLGAHYALWFGALTLTSVASATVLVTIHPLFVLPLTYLLWRERTTLPALLGLALALLGGVLIAMGDLELGRDHFGGDVLAVLAALAMAGYLMIGARVRPYVNVETYMATVYAAAAASLALAAILMKLPLWPLAVRDWQVVAALALVPTLLGHTLFNWALKFVSPSIVSVSVLGEPVVASMLAAALFAEFPSTAQWVGGTCIVLGVAFFSWAHPGRRATEEKNGAVAG